MISVGDMVKLEQSKKPMYKDPSDPRVWGQSRWEDMERTANALETSYDPVVLQERIAFFTQLQTNLPCSTCKDDSLFILTTIFPIRPEYMTTNGNAAYMMNTRHNMARTKLGKPTVSFESYKRHYGLVPDQMPKRFDCNPSKAVQDGCDDALSRYLLFFQTGKAIPVGLQVSQMNLPPPAPFGSVVVVDDKNLQFSDYPSSGKRPQFFSFSESTNPSSSSYTTLLAAGASGSSTASSSSCLVKWIVYIALAIVSIVLGWFVVAKFHTSTPNTSGSPSFLQRGGPSASLASSSSSTTTSPTFSASSVYA